MRKAPNYRCALVTGATSGIGRAVVHALVATGLQVVAVGRDAQALAELASYPGVEVAALDVRDSEQMAALVARFSIDVLVNNAGVLPTRAAFSDIEFEAIATMLDVNLKAPLQLTRQVLPGMVARGSGHLFFIGSSAGRYAHPNVAVYGASKAGLSLFCDALRCDLLGSGVRVTEIAPGRVQTQLYRTAIAAHDLDSELYDGYESILPEDIAELLVQALRLPAPVDVSRLEVFPTDQAPGGSRMVKASSSN